MDGSQGVSLHSQGFNYENEGERLGISFDRYQLVIMESNQLDAIIAMIERIDSSEKMDVAPFIEKVTLKNKETDRLLVGGFTSLEEANIEKEQMEEALGLSINILGPLHWNVGEFSDDNKALQEVNRLREKGFLAYLVEVYKDKKWKLEVWVGDSSTNTEHQALKSSLEKAFPGLTLHTAQSQIYLLHKEYGKLQQKSWSPVSSFVFAKDMMIDIYAIDENGTTVSSGIYLYRFSAETYTAQGKILFLK